MDYCKWNSGSATITGNVGAADTVILGGCSANYLSGTIGGINLTQIPLVTSRGKLVTKNDAGDYIIVNHQTGSGNSIEITEDIAYGETEPPLFNQDIFVFHFLPTSGGSFSINISGASPITLHKLFIGKAWEIIQATTYKVGTKMQGTGAFTDLGVNYGHKKEGYRHIECTWQFHDDKDRRVIERYVEAVQNCVAHFVEPCCDAAYIPPMFAVLDYDGMEAELQSQWVWYWKGQTLKYREAK